MKKMILVAMAAYMAIICLNAQEITKIGQAPAGHSTSAGFRSTTPQQAATVNL